LGIEAKYKKSWLQQNKEALNDPPKKDEFTGYSISDPLEENAQMKVFRVKVDEVRIHNSTLIHHAL
jgi:hypothetical protein